VGKLPCADRLWLDPVRAEQATHQLVAKHKAARFQGQNVVDLCCGIGGDTFALAPVVKSLVSLDLDAAAIRRLRRNLEILDTSSNVTVVRGNAIRPPVGPDFLIHIDPDRRANDRSGRPTRKIDEYVPGSDVLVQLMKSYRGGAIKLGPASDFEDLEKRGRVAGIRVESEIISLAGECKEATLWFGSLAGEFARRATQLPSGETLAGKTAGITSIALPDSNETDRWIFEVDPALGRSGLVANFARKNGLQPLSPDGSWLTGPVSIDSPWISRFEIVEEVAADRKVVRNTLRKLGWGTAVVKTRGGQGTERYARWFDENPQGNSPETMFVAHAPGGRTRAILAMRASTT
jgi:hypothetical protein